ncbi:MAG: glycine--tRNA ligase [Thermoplasmata archaeon]|nr:glycine--tRNA ligase [Thermoplasmata archaeon]
MKSDELFALLRRRGFLWPSAEIYGGAQGLFDYGPLGWGLKRRLEDAWTQWFVGLSDDYYRIEPAELLPEAVVRASGHLEHFTDLEVACGSCHSVFRADTVLERYRPEGVDGMSPEQVGELLTTYQVRCPSCGKTELSVPRPFNMMFGVDFGPTGGERAYLAPETAQASYLAFPRMWEVGRKALPLGIASVGKVYRNEIAPRQVLFRMRAFTQAELQIFFDPTTFAPPFASVASEPLPMLRAERRTAGEAAPELVTVRDLVDTGLLPAFYAYHLAVSYRFYRDVLGHPANSIRLYEKSDKERAFYNKIQYDIELHLDSLGGYRELGAVHYRGDYDLTRHAQGSRKDLSVKTEDGRRLLPHVLELTFGLDRNLWALADRHLAVDGERTVFRLPPYLAPVPLGLFPLLKKEHGLFARELQHRLQGAGVPADFDDAGSIGKRYARADEAGTPFAVTVDGESVADGPNRGTVTLRERDSKAQVRLGFEGLLARVAPTLRLPSAPVDAR